MVNDKYEGNFSVAVVRLGSKYYLLTGANSGEVTRQIVEQIELLGTIDFRVFGRYNHISI